MPWFVLPLAEATQGKSFVRFAHAMDRPLLWQLAIAQPGTRADTGTEGHSLGRDQKPYETCSTALVCGTRNENF